MRNLHPLARAAVICLMLSLAVHISAGEPSEIDIATAATPATSFCSGHETLAAINNGYAPKHSDDKSHGAYGNWPKSGKQWVQYDWLKPISTKKIDVYWFDDGRGVRLPTTCKLQTWDGAAFVDVKDAAGLGLAKNQYNSTTFGEITTAKLRLEFDSNEKSSTGILSWRVYDSGKSPNFAPVVKAGVDRVVMLPSLTWLEGSVRDDGKVKPVPTLKWSKESGPGEVTFSAPETANTSAKFSAPGQYVLKLTADDGELTSAESVRVSVEPLPNEPHLTPIATAPYSVSGKFWPNRVRALIVNWIPHCINKIDDPNLKEGGIENFVQAANKLAKKPAKHTGPVFANGWVYDTVEAMCYALMVQAPDDPAIVESQKAIRKTLDEWVPKILSAQEPDGYLQTMYTIGGMKRWGNKDDHEGFLVGHFIEACIAHYRLSGGKDTRMLDAAKRVGDCWCENFGPTKKPWYDGHQELELALVRLARELETKDGAGQGKKYVELSNFLLDCRKNGSEYDQSHLPVTRQYEAVGHAVRAVYCYAGMADIAMETGDVEYHGAVRSLCDSIVNKKYYVTGGVGSGETSEGFGKEYSLPNSAYCESCAGCGELFFQHRMQMIYHDARYADLFEETLYNAILGSIDIDGKNFTYTNALDSSGKRYLWHGCPCCVGNIPRTLLQMPEWMYSKGADTLFVNLFAGSSINVGEIAGTAVQMVQTTDYPWNGKVAITVNPATTKRFTIKVRAPNRQTSPLYTPTPACSGLTSLSVNGETVTSAPERGYVALTREWKAGDKIELVLPMVVQRIAADSHISYLKDRVALRVGPLIYNLESADQPIEGVLAPTAQLSAEWSDKVLDGMLLIKGAFSDGAAFQAIPNYARLNRGGRSMVWMKDK
ncbi:MAG TPA: beta-L-arabinofuranosidase domain-containing protein [Planctomycetota bacterium]|jgi:hypothetical protein